MLDYIGLFLEVNSGRFFFSSSLGFVIVRVCTKACVLKGVKIPEGLIVVIPVYSIQRDPSMNGMNLIRSTSHLQPNNPLILTPTCLLVMDLTIVLE